MSALAFDTLKFSKTLVAAGFTDRQAATLAEEQAALMDDKIATKRDLIDVETRLEVKLAETKADILKWVAGLLLTQTAVIAALVKLL